MGSKNRKAQTAKSADIKNIDAELFIPELEDCEAVAKESKWTEYETAIVRKYFAKVGKKKLAEYFAKDEKCKDRTANAIRIKANDLGCYRNK